MACSVDAALGRDRTSASARGAAAGPGTAIRTAISASSFVKKAIVNFAFVEHVSGGFVYYPG